MIDFLVVGSEGHSRPEAPLFLWGGLARKGAGSPVDRFVVNGERPFLAIPLFLPSLLGGVCCLPLHPALRGRCVVFLYTPRSSGEVCCLPLHPPLFGEGVLSLEGMCSHALLKRA